MATPVWPASLPPFVQEQDYSESLPDLTVESAVDSGPPKSRRRFTIAWRPLQGSIWCTPAQAKAFEVFYYGDLGGGALPFQWVNPLTQRLALMRFRKPAPKKGSVGSGQLIPISFALYQITQYADFRFDAAAITFDSTAYTFDQMNF